MLLCEKKLCHPHVSGPRRTCGRAYVLNPESIRGPNPPLEAHRSGLLRTREGYLHY